MQAQKHRRYSSGKDIPIDVDDPLFIHQSDNSITSIITIKLTRNENYQLWRSVMMRGLRVRNKLGFVDETLKLDKIEASKAS